MFQLRLGIFDAKLGLVSAVRVIGARLQLLKILGLRRRHAANQQQQSRDLPPPLHITLETRTSLRLWDRARSDGAGPANPYRAAAPRRPEGIAGRIRRLALSPSG